MTQSKYEQDLMQYAEAFLNGDREALGIVYQRTRNSLIARAIDKGVEQDVAEDIASEAILYVQGRGIKSWNGVSIMALLNRAVDWYAHNYLRASRMIVQADLPLETESDDVGEEFEHPMDLEKLEETRLQEGAIQHPYLTSITTRTPEDITLAENLRERLERIAREACGAEYWDIYAEVILGDASQAGVAQRHGISQQRVSQIITEVAQAIRAGLLAA